MVSFLYTVLYGKGVRELAGKFNIKDQFDLKFNVNGKEVSNEERAAYVEQFMNKMTEEMGGLAKKLSSKVTDTVANKSVDAIKEKAVNTLNINSIKDLLNEDNLSKLKEKLPVIDASNEEGNLKVNVNGKSLFSLDLSNFIKK